MNIDQKPSAKPGHVATLAGYFETQLSDLPSEQRALVEVAYWVGDWNELTPLQRLGLAWQYDTPKTDAERFRTVYDLQAKFNNISKIKPQTITEHDRKPEQLRESLNLIHTINAAYLQDCLVVACARKLSETAR